MPLITIGEATGPAGPAGQAGAALVGSGFFARYTGQPDVVTLMAPPPIPANSFPLGQMVFGIFQGTFSGVGDPKFLYLNFSPNSNPNGGSYITFTPAATERFWFLEIWLVRYETTGLWVIARYEASNVAAGASVTQSIFKQGYGSFGVSSALYLFLRGQASANDCIDVYPMQIYKM